MKPPKAPELNTKALGRKSVGKNANAKLPSQKAVDFLTAGSPSQQRIMQFGRMTPIGAGSATFGAAAPTRKVGKPKKGGF